jgi:hypothetical protein
MLSFSTEFPTKSCDVAAFVGCIRAWINGSPHTDLTEVSVQNIPQSGRWAISSGSERLEALCSTRAKNEIAAFRHVKQDGNLEWTTTVVFSKSPDDCWVGIRTSREAAQAQLGLPPAKKPFIVKTLLKELGGGLDGELHVRDQPYVVQENDLGMVSRLINGDSDNYLPVVYVSCGFDGRVGIDAYALARSLGGIAHVLIEPSRAFSRSLQENVLSRNVYGGSAGIYWPNGQWFRYSITETHPTEFDVRNLIVGRLRAAILHRRPLARCTWAKAEAEVARDAFEKLRATGSEDVGEYIKEFDAEIRAKDQQLEEAEEEIRRLRAQAPKVWSTVPQSGLTLQTGEEREFFDGEFAQITLDVIEVAINNVQDDSRRQHILSAMFKSNVRPQSLKENRGRLKDILRQYSNMDKETSKGLEHMGFSISDDGKHYKLVYMGDDRYTFALPKSGGDHRGGLNTASDIGKRIF